MNVLANLIILSRHLELYRSDLRTHFGWLIPVEPSLASSQPQVYTGQRLHVTIMEIASYRQTFSRTFEIANTSFELGALVCKESYYVAGYREISGPHHK